MQRKIIAHSTKRRIRFIPENAHAPASRRRWRPWRTTAGGVQPRRDSCPRFSRSKMSLLVDMYQMSGGSAQTSAFTSSVAQMAGFEPVYVLWIYTKRKQSHSSRAIWWYTSSAGVLQRLRTSRSVEITLASELQPCIFYSSILFTKLYFRI
ncbi:Hypothetical_protein [Hexamita inflata]|uniref:Hypothetical_protein n=1 Tax=Hexamita inflata TaxID=28002 RepID=A0AA86NBL4_9EUKA|nr:Hypothetical protein HINF_LOCUS3831 [Hexamita inflata]